MLPPRRYRVLRKAMLRESAARDSEPCGSLAVGDSVTSLRAVDDGAGVRVQVRRPHARAAE